MTHKNVFTFMVVHMLNFGLKVLKRQFCDIEGLLKITHGPLIANVPLSLP